MANLDEKLEFWRNHALECAKLITEFTGGGSECFAPMRDGQFPIDIEFCRRRLRERFYGIDRRLEHVRNERKTD